MNPAERISLKGLCGTIAFVLGIPSVLAWSIYGILFAVPAILLGYYAQHSERRALALAGIYLGVAGIVIAIATTIAILILARVILDPVRKG